MMDVVTASASTGLSPEWDRWFDETFTDLVTGDEELVRAEFDDLIASSWQSPSSPASPPVPSRGELPPERPGDDAPGKPGDPGPDPEPPSRPPP